MNCRSPNGAHSVYDISKLYSEETTLGNVNLREATTINRAVSKQGKISLETAPRESWIVTVNEIIMAMIPSAVKI